jgi:zinc protease
MTAMPLRRNRLLHGLATLLAFAVTPAQAGPEIQHWVADTGARVYFVESRALPMVDIQVSFAAGSAYDPADKAGLAALTRGLLDAGTASLDEQAIANRSADIGAQIGGGTDDDRASLSVRTLSSAAERDAAVALAAELLAHPVFPEKVLERERARSIAALREALTQPASLAARSFAPAVFGDHPYGRISTEASLGAITRDDLLRLHRQHYVAQRATVAIVGDVSRAEAAAIAQRLTVDLPAGEPAPPLPAPTLPERRSIRVDHPSAQAHLLIGQPGISRDDPDYYPLLVGNYVLGGGGFVSRLTREVREKRGYAYSVYSYFAPQRVAGPFQIGLQTRGAQVADALAVVEQTLAAFIAEGPTKEELQAARDNIINGFGLRLDSNRKILDHVAMIGFYGLPLDWLDAYPERVAAVTAEAVRDAFARRVRPEHLVTVIAGGNGDQDGAPASGAAE